MQKIKLLNYDVLMVTVDLKHKPHTLTVDVYLLGQVVQVHPTKE